MTKPTEPSSPAVNTPPRKRAEGAIRAHQAAAKREALAQFEEARPDLFVATVERLAARTEAKNADALNAPLDLLAGAGEAVVRSQAGNAVAHPAIRDTLAYPTSISVEASQRRLDAALGAQVLEPAVDAAVSAGATNSIEKMFWHQMAAVHHHAMKHLERSLADRLPPPEQVRYTNAAARLMDVYREGLLAWRRFKSGTTQTVIVQHVEVGPGGQALVAGSVKGARQGTQGPRRAGGGCASEGKTP